MKNIFILIILTGLFSFSFAQNDSISDDIDTRMEDIISNTESTEDADFTIVTDFLQDLLRKPLNLNNASREELIQLPGMNDVLINNLFEHIANTGELTSVYELQAVAGFSESVVQGIMPYVTTDARPKDIDPNRMHPAGPPVSEVRKGMQYEFIQRASTVLEEQKGYGPVEYNPDGSEKSHYLGSAFKNYTRLRARYGQFFSFAITGEKDAGERFQFKDGVFGYDFLSGHAAITNYGNLKSLVIGDYNIQTGQGLIFSSGLGFGKGAEVIAATKMQQRGIRPYASVNENSYRRGIAATYALKQFYFTGFFSRVAMDGSSSYSASDTLGTDENVFSGFNLGGLHRTTSEFEKRRSLFQTSTGGRIEYKGKKLIIGTSHLYQSFSTAILPRINYYNQFDFSGTQNYLNGLDVDYVFQNFNFFGEIARSRSGGMAGVAGVMAALSPKVDMTIHFRHFDKDFHSLQGYTFGEQPRTLQNETGLYMGLKIRPNTKWVISTFYDYYKFPYNRFGISFPSAGYDFLAQADYTIRRGTTIYARFRVDNKEYSADSMPDLQRLDYLIGQRRTQFRLQFQSQLAKNLMLRTRLETSWFSRENEINARGFLLYQDISYKLGFKFKITARYAVFDIKDYNARIYAYENDVPGSFSIIPYNGMGSRYYIMLNYKAIRGLDIWVRLSQTRYFTPNNTNGVNNNLYFTPNTIGSGLDEITGSTRSDLRLMVRYNF
ncbi:MAG: helix-hairpin-helix domain-containing protein [Bacteroidia bacterium]|nr:helix-hairpin-helix domain-containing protein [Bacteroidia bacterium]